MQATSVDTVRFALHMAGDLDTARRALRHFAYGMGECVTIAPEKFIYTGGEEDGFVVGLVCYPRFPRPRSELRGRMHELAEVLLRECCQKTCLIVGDDRTTWLVQVPPGETQNVRPVPAFADD